MSFTMCLNYPLNYVLKLSIKLCAKLLHYELRNHVTNYNLGIWIMSQITIFLTNFYSDLGNGFCVHLKIIKILWLNYMRHMYKINIISRLLIGGVPHVILTSILFQREEGSHRNYCKNHYDSDNFKRTLSDIPENEPHII